eukprot:m.479525 g.479525  ORF g.479525 m.479525 type:complete len:396 (+) comp21496_c0_seq1:157-1344(+)
MASSSVTLALAVLAVAASAAYGAPSFRVWRELPAESKHEYTFGDFVTEFARDYSGDELAQRRHIFEQRLQEIHTHNSDATATYTKGVNHLTDRTEEELKAMLGYRKALAHDYAANNAVEYNTELPTTLEDLGDLPPAVDWRSKGVITPVKDQGTCGSCWAFASTETIESYVALNKDMPILEELSPQQLVECSANPQHCGGVGGCQGSIPELAFNYVKENGMTTEYYLPYTSHDGKTCSPNCTCQYENKTASASIDGFVKLQPNSYPAVMTALATIGPLAVNVQANTWSTYEAGIFPVDGCNKNDTDIDHVVQLVGYGSFGGQDYFTIRNSWTPLWGEQGYIRLARSSTPVCNPDTTPLDGTGCTGGPTKVTVCGTCGVLYDASYVTGAKAVKPRA